MDRRTKRQKLEAMADHPRTPPNEAAAARGRLAALPPDPPTTIVEQWRLPYEEERVFVRRVYVNVVDQDIIEDMFDQMVQRLADLDRFLKEQGL